MTILMRFFRLGPTGGSVITPGFSLLLESASLLLLENGAFMRLEP